VLLFCTVTDYTVRDVGKLKPAFQVSTHDDEYGLHRSSLANDGILQTNYSVTVGGCVASKPETNPWWAVDIGSPTLVFIVKLTNRGDDKGRSIYFILL